MVVLLGEVKEEAGNCGIVRDEPMVEIGRIKEGAYVLDFGRG